MIGGGHYVYHDDAGQETITTGVMLYDPHTRGADVKAHAERMRWLGNASRFFNGGAIRDLDAMRPRNELVRAGHAYCLASDAREYALYSTDGSSFTLDLSALKGARCSARFYDPQTGRFSPRQRLQATARVTLSKPDERDWALLIQKHP
jgi:hypothetical protein